MKPIFLFALILLTSSAVSAQQQDPVMTRPQFTPFPKIPPVKLADMPIKPARMQAYQDRSLVHSSRLGKVYRMSVDNMLCLVPDANKTAPMPVKKTRMPEPMPNAYSRNRRF